MKARKNKKVFEGYGILSPKGWVLEAYEGTNVDFVLSRMFVSSAKKSSLVRVTAVIEQVDWRTVQKG